MSIYKKYSRYIRTIREYFYKTGAIEVFTSILQKYPNLDSNIYPVELFVYDQKGEKHKMFLHTSPEYQMKKILSEEKTDIFQITKVFRNFEGSFKHKIEFSMLEWYRVNYELKDIIDDTHLLLIDTVNSLKKSPLFSFRGKIYDIREKEEITVEEAFRIYTEIDYRSLEDMNQFLKSKEKNFKEKENWEELFFHIYAFYIEPFLGQEKLTFIYDYPPELSGLSRIINGYGKRFEAYIGGIELVNGYFEENDPEETLKRLKKDATEKERISGKKFDIDTGFLKALKDLPICSGASLGLERFFMVIEDLPDIHFL